MLGACTGKDGDRDRALEPRRELDSDRHPARGEVHDLLEIYRDLNQRYFRGSVRAEIGWGRRPSGSPRRRRSLRLGWYCVEDQVIRIHRTLDRALVPAYFVSSIVYHEMLHQKHPIPTVGGRRQYHTREFLAEERLFHDYERALLFARQNLHRLLIY